MPTSLVSSHTATAAALEKRRFMSCSRTFLMDVSAVVTGTSLDACRAAVSIRSVDVSAPACAPVRLAVMVSVSRVCNWLSTSLDTGISGSDGHSRQVRSGYGKILELSPFASAPRFQRRSP